MLPGGKQGVHAELRLVAEAITSSPTDKNMNAIVSNRGPDPRTGLPTPAITSPTMDPRRACVFCGTTESKITKEHVWPKWLREHVPLEIGRPIRHSRRLTTREGETVEDLRWEAIPLDWQVAAPCKECNEGWMEQIETATRPVLSPMLDDKSVGLDIGAADALAQWVTLRVMVAQHAYPKGRRRSIPEERYRAFFKTRQIPPGMQIWVGRYSGAGAWPTQFVHREIRIARPDSSPPNAYIVGFSVAYVAFVCWGHEVAAGAIVHLGQRMHDFLSPVWPALSPITWPPPGLLGADGLATSVANLIAMT